MFPLNGTFEERGLLNVSTLFTHSESFMRALCPWFGGYNDEDPVHCLKELRLNYKTKTFISWSGSIHPIELGLTESPEVGMDWLLSQRDFKVPLGARHFIP